MDCTLPTMFLFLLVPFSFSYLFCISTTCILVSFFRCLSLPSGMFWRDWYGWMGDSLHLHKDRVLGVIHRVFYNRIQAEKLNMQLRDLFAALS